MVRLGTIAFVIISAVVYLLATHHGIGILPDSTRYMGFALEPYDAPLYPWLLSGFSSVGLNIVAAARLLGLVLVCANSALIWYLLIQSTGKAVYAGIGTGLVVLSPHFTYLHSVAMSEPLFILTVLLSFFFLTAFATNGRREWLLACALTVGLSALARFNGIALGAAIVPFLLLNYRRAFGQRLWDVVILAAVLSAVFVSWAVLSELFVGRATGRAFQFYGNPDIERWIQGLTTLAALFLPARIPFPVGLAVLFIVLASCSYLFGRFALRHMVRPQTSGEAERQRGDAAAEVVTVVAGAFFISYSLFMVVAELIESSLPLNGRYALPIYVTTMMMITVVLSQDDLLGRYSKVWRSGALGIAILVLASHGVRTAHGTAQAYADGIGYDSVAWSESPIVRQIKQLPADAAIFSNAPEAVAYLTGRTTSWIPWRFERRTGLDSPDNPFEAQVENLQRTLDRGNGFVVILDKVDWRFYLASEAFLKDRLGLTLLKSVKDGRIYVSKETWPDDAELPVAHLPEPAGS